MYTRYENIEKNGLRFRFNAVFALTLKSPLKSRCRERDAILMDY